MGLLVDAVVGAGHLGHAAPHQAEVGAQVQGQLGVCQPGHDLAQAALGLQLDAGGLAKLHHDAFRLQPVADDDTLGGREILLIAFLVIVLSFRCWWHV